MAKSILREDRSYTFADYFGLAYPTKDIVAEFGYTFQFKKLDLPRRPLPKGALSDLIESFYRRLPHVSLNSEAAKREFLISPILLALLDYVDFDIEIEYPININEKLKGTIDYFVKSDQNLVIIEAKNADLERGFSQLAVQLIAMDQYAEHTSDLIYGAVTVGNIWQFGFLERARHLVCKDIDAFLVPSDIEDLFAVFIAVLQAPRTASNGPPNG